MYIVREIENLIALKFEKLENLIVSKLGELDNLVGIFVKEENPVIL
jgi:hypothetical protein